MPGNIVGSNVNKTLTWQLGAYISLSNTINNYINQMDIFLNQNNMYTWLENSDSTERHKMQNKISLSHLYPMSSNS